MSGTILVLGGTGMLGSHAARGLQQAGFSVRILARNPQKAHELFDDTFEIVPGDASDAEAVRRALDGCFGAHISLSETDELAGALSVAAEAKDARLEQISYVSGATVDEAHRWFPVTANKLQAEAAVRATGIPYTIFCPTWFMAMVHNNFIHDDQAVIVGQPLAAYHLLAAEDFGRMVAAAYRTEAARNRRLFILGPQALSIPDALQRICARLYPHITAITEVPASVAEAMAQATGSARLRMASQLMDYFARIGVEAMGDPAEANAILGAPGTTLDQWLSIEVAKRAKARS